MLNAVECQTYNAFLSKYQSFLYPLLAAYISRTGPSHPERIVDMGTGPGLLSIELAERTGAEVVAVDINPAMLQLLQSHHASRPTTSVIRGEIADVHSLKYPDNWADIVVSYSCYHHWADPGRALRECYRILRPGGRLFVFDTRAEVNPNTLEILKTNIPEPELYRFVREAFDESSTQAEVLKVALEAGLPSVTVQKFAFEEADLIECLSVLDDLPFSSELPEGEEMLWLLKVTKE